MTRRLLLALALCAAAGPSAAEAQRRFRVGPVVSLVSLDEGTGTTQFTAIGGTLALLTAQDAEAGFTITRYDDLSTTDCARSMTFYGLDSFYYPVGAMGLAPFASTQIGLARVTDENPNLLFGTCLPGEPTLEIAYGFGLGFRVNAGRSVAALLEGRFFQVPNSAVQTLEARANVSIPFGSPRGGDLGAGTLGPVLSGWLPLGGSLRGGAPFAGVRFRRDTRKSGVLGLQIDYASFEITGNCTSHCRPRAVLFAPAYEPSLHPAWGRFYGSLGALLAGFPDEGPDRGVAQGAHAGVGADIFTGPRVMVNVNARVVWLRRSGGENVFGVHLDAGVSPRLGRPSARPAPVR